MSDYGLSEINGYYICTIATKLYIANYELMFLCAIILKSEKKGYNPRKQYWPYAIKKCKDMQIYRFKIFYISVFVISDQNSAMKRAGEQVLKSAFRNSVPEEILACFYRSVDVEAFCTSCEAFEC